MKRTLGSCVLASLAFFFAVGLNAQVSLPDGGFANLPAQLQQQGWHEVAPGVFQRERPGQPLETIAMGAEGLPRALQELRHQFTTLLETYDKNPTPEVEQALSHIKSQIADLEKTISGLKPGEAPEMLYGCNFSFGCSANAYPLWDIQGVGADSSAYFFNDCYYQGTAYASASGNTSGGSDFQSRFGTDTGLSSSASIRVPGGQSCSSSAFSYVYAPDAGIYYSCYQDNYNCPPPPPHVNLYGPSYVTVLGYECVTEYWSAAASGGTPPYSYSWSTSYGGGTGDTFSITFCGSGYNYTDYVYVSVTATDAASQTASNSMTTTVQYQSDLCLLYRPIPICEPYY